MPQKKNSRQPRVIDFDDLQSEIFRKHPKLKGLFDDRLAEVLGEKEELVKRGSEVATPTSEHKL